MNKGAKTKRTHSALQKYVADSGIPLVARPVSFHAPYRWDGEVLASDFEGDFVSKRFGSDFLLLHEVHHWMFCPRYRRCLPDYGLGGGPTSHPTSRRIESVIHDGTFEEQVVATLDVIVMSQLGFDPDKAWEWWHEVWDDYVDRVWLPDRGRVVGWQSDQEDYLLDKAIIALRKKKLMTKDHERTLERLLGDMLPHTRNTLKRSVVHSRARDRRHKAEKRGAT